MPPSATAVNAEARSLREQARSEKRAAGRHRRRARELMRKLAELEQECAQHGIVLDISRPAQGGPSDHENSGSTASTIAG